MSELSIEEETAGPVSVIAMKGRVDSATAKTLETAVLDKIGAGASRLVFDFSDLEYISSAGLRVVLLAGKRLKGEGGKMVLCALRPTIRDVFEISGFLRLFEVEENRAAAIQTAQG